MAVAAKHKHELALLDMTASKASVSTMSMLYKDYLKYSLDNKTSIFKMVQSDAVEPPL